MVDADRGGSRSEYLNTDPDGAAQGPWSGGQILELMAAAFACAQAEGRPLAVLAVQVDRLASLAKHFGPFEKESLLDHVVELVRTAPRPGELFGIRQGDRFLFVLAGLSLQEAEAYARRLVDATRDLSFQWDGRIALVSASVGLAHSSGRGPIYFDTLVAVAKEGLSVASAGGGNRLCHTQLYSSVQSRLEREPGRGAPPRVGAPPAPPVTTKVPAEAPKAPPRAQHGEPRPVGAFPGYRSDPQPERRDRGESAMEEAAALNRLLSPSLTSSIPLRSFDRAARSDEVLAAAIALIEAERKRSLSQQSEQYEQRIDVLERRIAKMVNALSEAEGALARLAKVRIGDPGIASIYREVQGLDSDDVQYELKREMMADLFRANMSLRTQLSVAGWRN